MRVLIHCDEYYPTAQACAYRMQVFVDTFMALGDEVTVVTSSANKANGTTDKTLHKEKIIYSPAIRMKKKKPVIDTSLCIRCFCCQEFCPKGAMKEHRSLITRILVKG